MDEKSIFEGYESYVYLEEKDTRQLYILKTWYEKSNLCAGGGKSGGSH